MTKVSEINVPAQKNFGGLVPVCINATVQGKEPRLKSCPLTIIPELIEGRPQVSTLLRNLLTVKAGDSDNSAQMTVMQKQNLFMVSPFNAKYRQDIDKVF